MGQVHEEGKDEDEHDQGKQSPVITLLGIILLVKLSRGQVSNDLGSGPHATQVVILLEIGDHLLVDDARAGGVGNGAFQAIARRDEGLTLAVGSLGLDKDDNTVVVAFLAHAPLLADVVGHPGLVIAAKVVHGDDADLVAGLHGDSFQ